VGKILLIETATRVCSAAVSDGGNIVSLKESREQLSHSGQLTLFIQEVMQDAGLSFEQLDAVAVSMGPGSYTGLRIGVSAAKGICYAMDIPLIGINTLESLANGFVLTSEVQFIPSDLICPMIDARRMEVYMSLFDAKGHKLKDTEAVILDTETFEDVSESQLIWLIGDGATKCISLFADRPNIKLMDDFLPSSTFLASLAEEAFNRGDFADTAYFEPFYLKDFVAALPKVKGLN
jgi:tRNA threonylcarbamoyladenosine biosynthesis protein TsaB